LLVFIVAMQCMVQISGPYFAPFMLEHLRLSYAQYTFLLCATFLAKIITLPLFGNFAHRLGATRLLWIGGIAIAPVAGMWVVSQNFVWLTAVQVFSGIAWAAYELAFFLLFFESIDREKRTTVLTVYNLANSVAWVAGAAIGGTLLSLLGARQSVYLFLFGLSTVGRGLICLALPRLQLSEVAIAPIGVRTVAIRPNSAGIDSPIIASLPDDAG
jgi:MFS family permease